MDIRADCQEALSGGNDMLLALTQENESLKSQLDKALLLPKELESLHKKNRELNSKLLEANQKAENLQNRLKMSQQKTQEAESRQFTAENQIRQLSKDIERYSLEKMALETEIEKLKKNQNANRDTAEANNTELSKFFSSFSSVVGSPVSSFKQVIDSVNQIKEIAKKQAESNGKTKDLQKTIEKLESKVQKLREINQNILAENENLQNEHAQYQNELADFSNSVKSEINAKNDQNKNLQDQIEQLQAQLKQFSDDSTVQKSAHDEEVAQRDQEIAKLHDLLALRDSRIAELKERLALPEKQECEERSKLVDEIGRKEQEKAKLQNEIDDLHHTIADIEGKLKLSISQIKKFAKDKEKLRGKLQLSKDRIAELEKNIACLNLEKDSHFAQQNSTNLEIESLKMQLQAAEASHSQGASAFESQKQEIERLKKALALLEPMTAELRLTVENLTEEKTQLSLNAQKQDITIKQLEDNLSEANTKIENLEKKLKQKQEKESSITETLTSISSVISNNLIPLFQEPLKSRLTTVLNGTQGSPLQKCAAVFGELSNAFEQAAEPAREKVKEFENKMREADERKQLHESILSIAEGAMESFAYILRTGKKDEEAAAKIKENLNRSKDMIEFAASSIQNIEKVVRGNDLLDTQFVSMGFLVGGSFEDRRAAIQEIAVKGWDSRIAFDLLCLQMLVNQAQEKELQAMRTACDGINSEMGRVTEISGINDFEMVSEYIMKLKSKIKKLRSANKVLTEYLGDIESREQSIEARENLTEACDDLKLKLSEFDLKVKSLESKVEESEKEIARRDNRIASLESQLSKTHYSSTEEIQNLRSDVSQLEREIDEKNATIRTLTVQMSQTKSDAEAQITAAKRVCDENLSASNSRQEKLQQMIAQLKEKKKQTEKCLSQKMHEQQKAQQAEIDKLVLCQSELKQKLAETVQAMRQQSEENAALSKKLAENLAQSEERNRSMSCEITKLSTAKKTLEVQIEKLGGQHKRELQLINSQAAFKDLEVETKHQEEIAQLQAKLVAEKNNILMKVLEELGILDSIEDDIDEETAMHAIHKAISSRFGQM